MLIFPWSDRCAIQGYRRPCRYVEISVPYALLVDGYAIHTKIAGPKRPHSRAQIIIELDADTCGTAIHGYGMFIVPLVDEIALRCLEGELHCPTSTFR